jgi:dUTP pyrophosphatase
MYIGQIMNYITNTMEIKYQLTSEEAKRLQVATPESAGVDLISTESVIVQPFSPLAVPTGVKIMIPKGHYGRIAPKSGLSLRTTLFVNAGVVDSDFRGEIQVVLCNYGPTEVLIERGDKIAQLIIEGQYTSSSVFIQGQVANDTERGTGGFGSTDRILWVPTEDQMSAILSRMEKLYGDQICFRCSQSFEPNTLPSKENAPSDGESNIQCLPMLLVTEDRTTTLTRLVKSTHLLSGQCRICAGVFRPT